MPYPFWVVGVKEFWLEPRPSLSDEQIRKLVEDTRPDAVLVTKTIAPLAAKIASREPGGSILVTSNIDSLARAKNSNIQVALELSVRNREDHQEALKALELRPDYLLIDCPDWKIIPLENLIAEAGERSKLLAKTSSFEESKVALMTLELGVDGIALSSFDPEEILKTRELLAEEPQVELSKAKVVAVRPLGTGSRVCVDTTDIIGPREGLLTGSSSQALFLVEAEVYSNPHVNPRPFRVNAGPVSLYVLTPGGKTRYLSELSAGEQVLLIGENGRTRRVDVARVKIERRPMLLVEARTGERVLKTVLQNAETVRLVTPEGSKPVTELQPGDEVLVRLETGGRHFGSNVPEETVVER
jgi:3-dehydroquinate synthase II